ncbi:MAG TPA: 1-acyl-sn-glycerol-3-phosphate acyltransferase [Clostridiales bacterium]|nr:1-acyl-sn-glycerol-3-phosphate acyltransferase [Clostridiales bacterium]
MFYAFIRILAFIVLMPIFFIRVKGKENLKVEGGSVIIANHTSNWDPIILGFIVKHTPVCYMAKKELYSNGVKRLFLRLLQTIPVERGKGDLKAVKTALSALKDGKMLGIFPEGTRKGGENGEIGPFEQGAALLALRADVPVIPVYLHAGGYRLFHRVTAYAAPPVYLRDVVGERTSSSAIGGATEYLREQMIELREKSCRS